MATKVYTGVSGVAQRVRKIYIGVNGVAQKVRKGYIGVAGVARQFFASSGKIVFRQTKLLSSARSYIRAAKAGSYAVFGPGIIGDNYTFGGNYDAYDTSLTLTTVLSETRDGAYGYGAASVGNYAIYAGGLSIAGSRTDACTAIDGYLTRTAMYSGLNVPKSWMGTATIGGYALFAGGEISSGITGSVEAFDASLTKTTATALNKERTSLSGANTKDYAVFAGGYNDSATGYIDRYNASLTRSTGYLSSAAMSSYAAASAGKYAVFAGTSACSVNNSGTATAITSLSHPREFLSATTLGDYAMFAGGEQEFGSGVVYTTIDTYDTSLTRESKVSLSVGRKALAAATIGNYALIGGGDKLSSWSSQSLANAVDIYELTD